MTIGLPSEKPGKPLPTQPVIVTNLFAESALVWASAGAAIIAAIPQSTIVFMGASSLIHECKGSAVAARLGYAMESRHAALAGEGFSRAWHQRRASPTRHRCGGFTHR